jgi:hypothetical protein
VVMEAQDYPHQENSQHRHREGAVLQGLTLWVRIVAPCPGVLQLREDVGNARCDKNNRHH